MKIILPCLAVLLLATGCGSLSGNADNAALPGSTVNGAAGNPATGPNLTGAPNGGVGGLGSGATRTPGAGGMAGAAGATQ